MAEKILAVERILGAHAMLEAFELREYAEGTPFEAAGYTITPVRVPHYDQLTFALRVTDGERTLAYSGDSAPSPALAEVARDADLFLCEATLAAAGARPPRAPDRGRGGRRLRGVGRAAAARRPPAGRASARPGARAGLGRLHNDRLTQRPLAQSYRRITRTLSATTATPPTPTTRNPSRIVSQAMSCRTSERIASIT